MPNGQNICSYIACGRVSLIGLELQNICQWPNVRVQVDGKGIFCAKIECSCIILSSKIYHVQT